MVELDAETQVQAPVNIPTDYMAGYGNAQAKPRPRWRPTTSPTRLLETRWPKR